MSWATAMRDLRTERLGRAEVREERLRATSGIRAGVLTSWRGLSGRRYVVGIHAVAPDVLEVAPDGVLIAVGRGPDGTARVIDVSSPQPSSSRRSRLRWLASTRVKGATEVHVHLLAENQAERDAVMRDLSGADAPRAA